MNIVDLTEIRHGHTFFHLLVYTYSSHRTLTAFEGSESQIVISLYLETLKVSTIRMLIVDKITVCAFLDILIFEQCCYC